MALGALILQFGALKALIGARCTSSKAVWRAPRLSGRRPTGRRQCDHAAHGQSKPCVCRWQERYVEEGVDDLTRRTRPRGKKPLPVSVKRKVLAKTASETRPNATHWSTALMAAEMGISPSGAGLA
jgi:hypothetical protein